MREFRVEKGSRIVIGCAGEETAAVRIAAENLKRDLERVLDLEAALSENREEADILVGTLGGPFGLESRVDVGKLRNDAGELRKEAYIRTVADGKLVIVGTDRRGTIYGIYDFCEWLGVSPWYFWGDVPVRRREQIRIQDGYEKVDYPSVEYRGIFINDEEELERWAQLYMGEETIGLRTYEKIFELLLRLRANYIWPAMHVNSFNRKKENGALAERMGIVVGTSHCDMLMRSNNREWGPWLRKKGYTDVRYDYSIPGRNREILREYWRESVEQNRDFEVCYTLGMRGIHDSGFETSMLDGETPEELLQSKTELLSAVIRDQREILRSVLGRDPLMTFIPYKEVLELYDKGAEIPEELTLVWANDNYGYIRRYPSEKEKGRPGGNGIYYHNSYWAPPSMSYVFLCSIPLAHTRNELQKAWDEGIRKLWVLNSGAMKPLEQEITFFLRLAWEIGKPGALTENVETFVEDWIDHMFSGNIGKEVSGLLNDFSQLTNVRKVENMDSGVFSQTAYGDEAAVRIHAYERLFERGNALYEKMREEEKDAFFQMVLLRIHAAYYTNLQYYYGDRSTLAYDRGRMQAAAFYTGMATGLDDARRKLLYYYNHIMSGGKWNGIVNPEGFPPPRTAMLPVCTPPLSVGERKMLVDVWNDAEELCFVRQREKWIEVANGGAGEFAFAAQAPEWVELSEESGIVRTEKRIMVRVRDTSERREGKILLRNLTDKTDVEIPVRIQPADTACDSVEEDGKLAVDADSVPEAGSGFHLIRRLGRGRGGLMEARGTGKGLSYRIYVTGAGEFTLEIHRFPSLNATGRIRVGVSVDGGAMCVAESFSTDEWRGNWKENVLNNVDRLYLKLPWLQAGQHVITFHPIDRYFAFSRFVIYTGQRRPNNYIGISGRQELPGNREIEIWDKALYGGIRLEPRPVEYAKPDGEEDSLTASGWIRQEKSYAAGVRPEWYPGRGSAVFAETGSSGAIRIDAAAALAESRYAYTSGEVWRHCRSESFGRTGLAMYHRQKRNAGGTEDAPALHYRMQCSQGAYRVWILTWFGVREEAFLGLGVDGVPLREEELYQKGCLWRYEAEQIYRWTPVAVIRPGEGVHELEIYALSPGMRYDRIYLTHGKELPPMDGGWSI